MNKLPKGWESKYLGDHSVSLLIMGQSPASSTYNSQKIGLPFYQGKKDFGELYPTPTTWCVSPLKIAERNDILLSVRAPVGPTNLCAEKSCIGRGLAAIRPNNEIITTKFLLYFLKSFEEEIAQKGKGSTFLAITKKELEHLSIPLPPLDEQQRIVATLDVLFARIDKSITLLQANIAHTQTLLPSVLDEVFENDLNCEHEDLSQALTLYNGRAYKRNELLDNGKYKVIRIQNLKGGKNWFFSDLELSEEKYCNDGDLLYSWSGTPGTSFGAFIWHGDKAIYHYHIWKIEFKKKLNVHFAYYQLKYITNIAIENSHGVTGMMHITKGKMEKMPFRVPDYSLQEKIVEKLSISERYITKLLSSQQAKLTNLKALKASLLDRAFQGKLV